MTDWENHYRTGEMPWDKSAPSPALLEALETVPVRGRVLVPGAGRGHDLPPLAREAEEVVGIDIAPSAVALAREERGSERVRFEHEDLFALPTGWQGTFDWVWEHTCFCAIDPAQRRAYAAAVAGALRPSGQFLGVFYLDPGQTYATDGPPFETTLGELDCCFSEHFALVREWCPTHTYPGREGREWLRWYRLRAPAP